MPDLLSGSPVTPLDTPPTVDDREDGSFTFTITSFGVTATGTYADCGVAFLAPTTGRVTILWGGNLLNSTSASTLLAPVVRTGSTVGSGSVVLAASNPIASGMQGGSAIKGGRGHLLTGLTPGDTYNVRLEHRVTAGTGTISERNVIVRPES
mgnify:CR=1 FL=1